MVAEITEAGTTIAVIKLAEIPVAGTPMAETAQNDTAVAEIMVAGTTDFWNKAGRDNSGWGNDG
jgi:hypothetical protein